MRAVRVSLVTVVCTAAVPGVAGASVTRAATSPPPSAVAQYVEAIPTSSGDQALGSRPAGAQAVQPQAPPPPPVVRSIERQGGADAPALKRIVSSPDYGAPTRTRARKSPTGSPVLAARDPGLLSAAFGGGGSAHDADWGLGALALITVTAGTLTFLRRRRSS